MSFIQIVSIVIFVITLGFVFTDRLHRLIAAAAGAAAMVVAGYCLGFYSEHEALEAIDFETLGLLLGMMILVRLLEDTGFFEYAAIVAARKSGGNPWRLMLALGVITTLLSLVLDNVTTVVLIAPLAVLISELVGLSPVPVLIAIALLSDTGGIATLIGDPPNVLIGSAAGLSFASFIVYLAPIVLVVWIAALLLLRHLFRFDLAQVPTNVDALQRLDVSGTVTDEKALRRIMIVIAATVAFFFVQGLLGISPAMVALIGAAAAMLWVQPKVNETLSEIEWSVLLFFVALFVLVGGLESAGVLALIAECLHSLRDVDPRLVGIMLMWGVAVLSAIVDNIPITIATIPVILQLEATGMNVSSLWWALALGAGLGGNGTIVGSTANIVVVSVSERTRTPITPQLWMRRGLPVMLVTLAIASILFVVLFPWLNQP
jgi:Na+/H+ antiporter NhaD/arsenite permease-like protein